MNEIIQNMETRRSVRGYKPDAVPQEILDQIIEAGLYAPNGMSRQSGIIVAVTDKEIRDRLSAANAAVMGKEGFDPFYGAPVVLVVLADKSVPTHVYDGSLVMGNLMNAAHALGVDSIWIHRAKEVFEQPEWKAFLEEHGVTGEYEGIGHCALGYASGPAPATHPLREGRVIYV